MPRALRNVAVYFGLAESEQPAEPMTGSDLIRLALIVGVAVIAGRVANVILDVDSWVAELAIAIAAAFAAGVVMGALVAGAQRVSARRRRRAD